MPDNEKKIEPKLTTCQAALDELSRELNVRLRCFPRWVAENRVSATDAQDRLDRLHTAHHLLKRLIQTEGGAA